MAEGLQGHHQLPAVSAGKAGGPGWPSPELPSKADGAAWGRRRRRKRRRRRRRRRKKRRRRRRRMERERVEYVFTEVMGQKWQQPGPERGAKRLKKEAWSLDQDFYVPYQPKDFNSEQGLSVGGDRGTFEQQVAGAVLNLLGDEAQNLTRGWQQLKWGRKKKQFVGQSGQEDKKKIKTESGRYISNSYKWDVYQKWKQKQKIAIRSMPEP